MQNLEIILIVGIPFTIIGSIISFLISYREYQHHFSDKKKVMKISLGAALFTLCFFGVLLLTIWFFLNKMFLS